MSCKVNRKNELRYWLGHDHKEFLMIMPFILLTLHDTEYSTYNTKTQLTIVTKLTVLTIPTILAIRYYLTYIHYYAT